jgi:hypothetical protein
MNPTPAFAKWASGFSGCDGGNLRGSVWFCGIEWGAGQDHDLATELRHSVSSPPQLYESHEDVLRDRVSGKHYPCNVKLLKLIAAMRGQQVAEYRRVAQETPFPFHCDSDYFKLNLFPVAFQKVDPQLWNDKYKSATGLATREEYLEWCREHRFPQIRSWMALGQPKLVVGVGSSCKDDFRQAFGFMGAENKESIEGRPLFWMSKGETVLAVIPFLGPFRLDSDKRLQAFGRRLGALRMGAANDKPTASGEISEVGKQAER